MSNLVPKDDKGKQFSVDSIKFELEKFESLNFKHLLAAYLPFIITNVEKKSKEKYLKKV